jgi:hypothetical protein
MNMAVPIGTIYPDEKAYSLSEINKPSRCPKGGIRRVEVLLVNRGDRVVSFERDMGLAKNYRATQFCIPSMWEHSVAELREIAHWMREVEEQKYLSNLPHDDLINGLLNQEENKWRKRNGRRQFSGIGRIS